MDSIYYLNKINGKDAAINSGGYLVKRKDAEELIKAATVHLENWSDIEINEYNENLYKSRIEDDKKLEIELKQNRKKRKIERDLQLWVYVMENKRNGLFKIGVSKNPGYREKTFQSEEPEIELFLIKKGGYSYEQYLHKLFQNKRKRGEWFALNEADLALLIQKMKQ